MMCPDNTVVKYSNGNHWLKALILDPDEAAA